MAEMKKYHPDITSETAKNVVDILAYYGSHHMETENISKQTHLIDDLCYDSLDSVHIIMDMEEDFDISIPDEDADKILEDPTIGTAIDYVQKALSEKQTQKA